MYYGNDALGLVPSHQSTSAMHNIIASERSSVECARDEIYAHSEITITRI